MPKETIYGVPRSLPGEGLNDADPERIDIAWGHDTQVQFATLSRDGHVGMWVDADRDTINRVIRTLRKARDQAYGIDE